MRVTTVVFGRIVFEHAYSFTSHFVSQQKVLTWCPGHVSRIFWDVGNQILYVFCCRVVLQQVVPGAC